MWGNPIDGGIVPNFQCHIDSKVHINKIMALAIIKVA